MTGLLITASMIHSRFLDQINPKTTSPFSVVPQVRGLGGERVAKSLQLVARLDWESRVFVKVSKALHEAMAIMLRRNSIHPKGRLLIRF